MAYFVTLMLRLLSWALFCALAMTIWQWIRGTNHSTTALIQTWSAVVKGSSWLVIAGFPILVVFWRISFRLKERQAPRGSRTTSFLGLG
jgi:hypothetical protein